MLKKRVLKLLKKETQFISEVNSFYIYFMDACIVHNNSAIFNIHVLKFNYKFLQKSGKSKTAPLFITAAHTDTFLKRVILTTFREVILTNLLYLNEG